MDHGEALRLMAAEKYLLGELPPELREQFEEHYFGCPDCAMDLRAGSAFVAHSKVLLAPAKQTVPAKVVPESHPGRVFGWLRPALWAPAMAALLIVIGYQNLVTYPKLRGAAAIVNGPQLLASVSLLSADTRGINRQVLTVKKNEPFLLYLDVPADPRFSSYQAELRGPSGSVQWSLAISPESAKDTLPIRVPPTKDGVGIYTLVLSGVGNPGQQNSQVGRYPFELKIQD